MRKITLIYGVSDAEDCVYFNDVLFATLKKAYEKYITKDADSAVLEFVRHQEVKTVRLLQKNKVIALLAASSVQCNRPKTQKSTPKLSPI